ncbi:hypothetical protein HK097_000457 [Rhizophlyctis rosea]|uniref:Uncharacterized protein n=1 Tax=Rhizophlyctis rosea TaxID=64517 RepID=A0AAD5S6Q2_9FUNG|nr:hypothetical protein HK097_000457 [Rhizophlyctis rosea]
MRTQGAYYAKDHGNILAHNAPPTRPHSPREQSYTSTNLAPLPPIQPRSHHPSSPPTSPPLNTQLTQPTQHQHPPSPPQQQPPHPRLDSGYSDPYTYPQPTLTLLRDPYQETSLQNLYQRLTESEDRQRDLSVEIVKVRGEMEELGRWVEEGRRDVKGRVGYIEQTLQDHQSHFRSLSTQTQSLSTDVSQTHSQTLQTASTLQSHFESYTSFTDSLHQTLQSLASQLSTTKSDIQTLQSSFSAFQDHTDSEFASIHQSQNEQTTTLEKTDERLTKSLQTADQNLLKTIAMFQDAIRDTRTQIMEQTKDMVRDLERKVEEFGRSGREGLEGLAATIYTRIDELGKEIEGVKREADTSRAEVLGTLEERVRDVGDWALKAVEEEKRVREEESEAFVGILNEVRGVLKVRKEEDEEWREMVRRDVESVREEVRAEVEGVREGLEKEIRKVARPLIVM